MFRVEDSATNTVVRISITFLIYVISCEDDVRQLSDVLNSEQNFA